MTRQRPRPRFLTDHARLLVRQTGLVMGGLMLLSILQAALAQLGPL